MPFTRVGGISHVRGGGDCPRRHNSRIKGGDCPRLAKQSQLYSPVFYGMPGDRAALVVALFIAGPSWGKSAGVEDAAMDTRV